MSSIFEDPTFQPADQSSSLLQSPGQDPPGIGMVQPVSSSVPGAAPGLSIVAPQASPVPPDAPGIGVAPQSAPATPTRSTTDRLMSALAEFGAGVTGRPSPMMLQAKEDRQAQAQSIETFTNGMKALQSIPDDDTRAAVAEKMAPNMGDLKDAFVSLAKQPDFDAITSDVKDYLPYLPAPLQAQAKRDPIGFMRTISSPDGLKEIAAARNQMLIQQGTNNARVTMATIQQHPDALVAAGVPQQLIDAFQKQPSASTFGAINDLLPDTAPSKMSDAQMQAALQSKFFHSGLGMLGPEAEQEVQKQQAIAALKPNSPVAKAKADLNAGRITQDEYDATVAKETGKDKGMWSDPYAMNGAQVQKNSATGEIRTAVTREPVVNVNNVAPVALTENGRKVYADLALQGKLPPGFRGQSQADRNNFLNDEGEKRYGVGGTGVSAAGDQASAQANKTALVANQKDLTAIKPYKDMLDTNASIAIDLAGKVLKTDASLANRPITWIEQNATDNPAVGEFMAQNHFVTTEAARVLNNPRLVGQMTDSAVKDMQAVVNGNAPLGTYTRVMQRIMKDGNNRVNAMQAEHDRLVKAFGGPAQSAPPAQTPGLPPGWTVVQH